MAADASTDFDGELALYFDTETQRSRLSPELILGIQQDTPFSRKRNRKECLVRKTVQENF